MARKLNQEEEGLRTQKDAQMPFPQASWFQKIDEQRDATLHLTPELSAWFGEQFTAHAHLWEWPVDGDE